MVESLGDQSIQITLKVSKLGLENKGKWLRYDMRELKDRAMLTGSNSAMGDSLACVL